MLAPRSALATAMIISPAPIFFRNSSDRSRRAPFPEATASRRARTVRRVRNRCMVKAKEVAPSPRPKRLTATTQSWIDVTPMPPNSLGTAAPAKPLFFKAVMFSIGKIPLRSFSAAVIAKSVACFSANSTMRLPASVDACSSKSNSSLRTAGSSGRCLGGKFTEHQVTPWASGNQFAAGCLSLPFPKEGARGISVCANKNPPNPPLRKGGYISPVYV